MRRIAILLILAGPWALAQKPASGGGSPTNPVAVARRFLPPNSALATDYLFNFRAGRVTKRWPAVLTGHITGPDSWDIVFAYYSPAKVTMSHTLFLDLVERSSEGYEKLYEISFRPQVLFGPRGLRLVRLRGVQTDAVAFVHGVGATLGASLDILVWRHPWGWRNIFPSNSTGYTYFFPRPSGLQVALSTANRPGLNVSPPPVWYRWNGKRFAKIPPPPGSSKWPLPN